RGDGGEEGRDGGVTLVGMVVRCVVEMVTGGDVVRGGSGQSLGFAAMRDFHFFKTINLKLSQTILRGWLFIFDLSYYWSDLTEIEYEKPTSKNRLAQFKVYGFEEVEVSHGSKPKRLPIQVTDSHGFSQRLRLVSSPVKDAFGFAPAGCVWFIICTEGAYDLIKTRLGCGWLLSDAAREPTKGAFGIAGNHKGCVWVSRNALREPQVHEMIIKKDYEIVKEKVKMTSLALKAKKESSDEECLTFESEDKEYAMTIRDFKKFFKRR
nr:transposase, Ptta/En/Spm, transposase, Tnp1/En/Spm-like protein [Tanacetum cinerariifolium]